MGSYSQLFSLLQNMVALIAACAFALLGGCITLVGALVINTSGWMARRFYPRQLLRDLMAWGAMVAYSNPAEVVGLVERFTQLTGWLLLGGGLGMLAASGALAFLASSVTGLSLGIEAGTFLGSAIVYYGFALGATIGHLAGTYAVTRVATGPAWADLRRRQVSDYRASWLGWGSFALAGVTILPLVVTLFLQPRIQAQPRIQDGAMDTLFPSWPTPIIVAVIVWALLVPTLGALLCRSIATSPRALTFSDPQVARAADELRRAISIGFVTSLTWASGGLTLTSVGLGAPFTLIASFNPATTPLPPLVVFGSLILLSLLGMLALGFGISLGLLRGRLGGRLAGARPSLQVFLAEMTPL